jgi:hypothetical protein
MYVQLRTAKLAAYCVQLSPTVAATRIRRASPQAIAACEQTDAISDKDQTQMDPCKPSVMDRRLVGWASGSLDFLIARQQMISEFMPTMHSLLAIPLRWNSTLILPLSVFTKTVCL